MWFSDNPMILQIMMQYSDGILFFIIFDSSVFFWKRLLREIVVFLLILSDIILLQISIWLHVIWPRGIHITGLWSWEPLKGSSREKMKSGHPGLLKIENLILLWKLKIWDS